MTAPLQRGAPTLPAALEAALAAFAARPRVLVALDFDGTLAPLVDDPMQARALPGTEDLLGALAHLPHTTVAIVSGRALADLLELTRLAEPVVLVGSHGVERSTDRPTAARDETEEARFAALDDDLAAVVRTHPQARVERKPHSLVLHTRGLTTTEAQAALRAAEDLSARHTGVVVTPGKDILELATRHVGKGNALRELASEHGVDAVIFVGDDITDERAFALLGDRDVTVRVGGGPTAATHRVADEAAVQDLLSALLALRTASV